MAVPVGRGQATPQCFLVATRRILSTLCRILVLHSDALLGVADHPV